MSLGFLTKYLFIYLIFAVKIIFILQIIKNKEFKTKFLIPGTIFILILTPHLIWLFQNDFVTIKYALNRTGIEQTNFLDHLYNPYIFIAKQIVNFISKKKIKMLILNFRKCFT